MTVLNLGCNHYHEPHYHGHCSMMGCRNYICKCPRHTFTGSDTAVCNLKRAREVGYMSKETRDLAIRMIELNPAMEESILTLIASAFEDGRYEQETV